MTAMANIISFMAEAESSNLYDMNAMTTAATITTDQLYSLENIADDDVGEVGMEQSDEIINKNEAQLYFSFTTMTTMSNMESIIRLKMDNNHADGLNNNNNNMNVSDSGGGNLSLAMDNIALATTRTTIVQQRIGLEQPIWLIPCYSTILLFAVIGNLLVISTLVQNRRMRTITNFFLLNLAISDILLGVLCMPVTLVGTLLRHFIFGELLCKLIPFSQAASVAVSSWTLVAISCERYYAICHPLRSRTWQTINHAYKIIGFIWFGSILCMMPIAIFSQLMPTSRQGFYKCRELWPKEFIVYERSYNIFLDLALLVLPLLILCIAYILITRTLYIGMKQERAMIFGNSTIDSYKFNGLHAEVATLTTTTTTTTTATTTNGTPSSQFTFNTSLRWQGRANRNSFSKGGGGGGCGGGSSISSGIGCVGAIEEMKINPDTEIVYQQHHSQRKQYYDDYIYCAGGSSSSSSNCSNGIVSNNKRKMLTSSTSDGRRHLYCMRSASFKSLSRTNTMQTTATATQMAQSPTTSMTVINVPQQQRFKLNLQRQQHYGGFVDRRKSHGTTMNSIRINEAALRRSNMTKNLESKKRVVKMLFVLVLEFFVCWTPIYVINTLTLFFGPVVYEYVDYTSISFFHLLAYSSSCCNPITYCFMNAGFRRAFLDTFRGVQFNNLWRRRHKSETNLCVAGNSLNMANSVTMMTNNTVLDSPRL